jgi:hypothetical protein
VRNQVLELYRRESIDPSDIVWEFYVQPHVDGNEAVLFLGMVRTRFAAPDSGAEPELLQGFQLAKTPLGAQGQGPDWPAIALLGSDRLAVGWVEPEGASYKIRFDRFRVCYPPPDGGS